MDDRETAPGTSACDEWLDRLPDEDRQEVDAFGDQALEEMRGTARRLGDLWAFMLGRDAPATCLHEVELALNSLDASVLYLELALQRRRVGVGCGG